MDSAFMSKCQVYKPYKSKISKISQGTREPKNCSARGLLKKINVTNKHIPKHVHPHGNTSYVFASPFGQFHQHFISTFAPISLHQKSLILS
jgi:hypothetical protein